jgi:hypothetical protein
MDHAAPAMPGVLPQFLSVPLRRAKDEDPSHAVLAFGQQRFIWDPAFIASRLGHDEGTGAETPNLAKAAKYAGDKAVTVGRVEENHVG